MSVATAEPTLVAVPSTVVRRIPTPLCEPPYDDERSPDDTRPQVLGALTLPFDPPTARRLRLVPQLVADDDVADPFTARRTPRSALPDPRMWGGRLTQAVTEVLDGHRPIGQLLRWVSEDVYEEVEAQIHRQAACAGRTESSPVRRVRRERSAVRSVHVCEPEDGVAELCATVRREGRTTAVALRLEGVDGRWLCTALQR